MAAVAYMTNFSELCFTFKKCSNRTVYSDMLCLICKNLQSLNYAEFDSSGPISFNFFIYYSVLLATLYFVYVMGLPCR